MNTLCEIKSVLSWRRRKKLDRDKVAGEKNSNATITIKSLFNLIVTVAGGRHSNSVAGGRNSNATGVLQGSINRLCGEPCSGGQVPRVMD